MKKTNNHLLLLATLITLAGCKTKSSTSTTVSGPIIADSIKSQIAVLANDSLTGRKPFTPGETKTINYIASQFKKAGLEPGNNGSYFQDVPMVQIACTPWPTMQIDGKAKLSLKAVDDFVVFSRREQDTVQLKNSPMVFAGYGVVAPEYHWNDYAGLDVKGKTVVVLVNDPGFKSGDPTFFKGDTMTYYGRWTYKFEEAARQGASGIIIVHQTEPASYAWSVIKNSNTGARLYLQQADKHMSRCKMEGWITEDAATKLFAAAGITGDFRALARRKDFRAIPLNLNLTVGISNKLKYAMSRNVIATLKGSSQPTEAIIYTAHWDHFGIGPAVKGDSIYNGAVDNASGVAALINMAKAFSHNTDKPKRSIVFLAVTGEEQGLLGSEYYATHPIFALNKTVANLNMDALGFYGETKDIDVTGKGQNDIEDYVAEQAQQYGLTIKGDARPGAGSYYRSDHFNFAKVGVPALDMNNGQESTQHPEGWGKAQKDDYNTNRYHQVSDNYSADMDCTGMAQVANILFNIGTKLGNQSSFPGWKPKSEFKVIRDKTMGK
ncbi:Zn-dependent M28 family amino/carboxypeptidase [Mucilaginibacter gracilis]|uniref:Zn-dependent M28 family amino/carboxypeptidase n=1 Tax=Mucilaginibacter gracilis TaxID=423350 RepID=A0A495IZN6_9SPHI|nr:M28 family metallopeptidase [Mucilaginibacter gracilis]RKR81568.1 Zn-dependent M28 family amino/carboxypeptidase [Mucilaginibacter gracilis]